MDIIKLAEYKQYIKDNHLDGVEVRGTSMRIRFYYHGAQRNETLKGTTLSRRNLKFAANKRAAILNEIDKGIFDYLSHFPNSKAALRFSKRPARYLFADCLDRWLAVKQAKTAPETYRSYKSKAENHIRPKWGSFYLDEIKKSDIEYWINVELWNHNDKTPYSNKTINDMMTVVRGVLGDAYQDEVLKKDPTERIDNLKTIKDTPDPFTQDEISSLVNVPTDRLSEILCFELACWTGLSVSELLGIAWEDLDKANWRLRVRRANVNGIYKTPKEESRSRDIDLLIPARWVIQKLMPVTSMLPPVEISILQKDNKTYRIERLRMMMINTRSGKPMPSNMQYRDRFFTTICKKANVRYRPPNNSRHTYASQLLTKGVPKEWIANQLGHTTTKMIDEHYGKWMKEEAPNMAAIVSEMLGFSVPMRPPQDHAIRGKLGLRYKSKV
ncbi:MAG: DUF3596 domain-containing protein [Psychrobium sp.]|nr:DUF3596 domain-containing protein [Psychrobium sp.]